MDAGGPADIQLPHLATFAKAAELSSFTGAAKVLRLTQAAVSQCMHALEAVLGKPLFQRRGGRVVLTDAGRKLYDYAQRIWQLHQAARQEIAGQATTVSGELLLAASSIPGEQLLPMLLSVFRQKYPRIQVRASVSDSATVLAEVERGQVSLGLVGRKADSPHLEFRFLARDRMVLVVPPGHPLSKRKTIPVEHLCRHPFVLRESGSGLRHCLEKSLERVGLSLADLRVALELGSNEAIKAAVLGGVGVAILSIHAVRKEIDAGQLHALAVSGLRCDRDMFIVWDRRRVLAAPARLFLHFLETNPVPSP